MLVIDPWLMDLGVQGPEEAMVAAMIGRAQFRTSRRLRHIMNLGGAAERERMALAAHGGRISDQAIFCLRCGAGAHLSAWVRDDIAADSGEVPPALETLTDVQMFAIAFRLPCQGMRVTKVAGAMLKKFLDERGVPA